MRKFFENIKSLAELKKAYKELARENHPDLGGSVEVMQAINAEYDKMIEWFAKHGNKTEQEKASTEVPEKFRKIIEQLIKMSKIQIEIIGGWIWLSGNTAVYLRKLQGMGFQYSTKQKRYYLADGITVKCRATHLSMDRIRDIYGSQIINSENQKTLMC